MDSIVRMRVHHFDLLRCIEKEEHSRMTPLIVHQNNVLVFSRENIDSIAEMKHNDKKEIL